MLDGGEIKATCEDFSYRRIYECSTVRNEKIKTLMWDEYMRRLKSKSNQKNIAKSTNTFAVNVLRYNAFIVK